MERPQRVVATIQQKGGVGKTTLTVNLAITLQALYPSLKVAIVDADSQLSAREWVAAGNGAAGIELVPIAREDEDDATVSRRIKEEIRRIDADVIFLDTPPKADLVSLRAALMADLMLVPVGASRLEIKAARKAVDICEEAVEMAPNKKYLIVQSRLKPRTKSSSDLREVLEKLYGPVARTAIYNREDFLGAVMAGVGIHQYAKNSQAAAEIRELAREVAALLGIDKETSHEQP